MVKISVIIPVYNAEKYIGDCLDSLLSQTFEYIEIICVNDGSTDTSLEILKKYKSKDNRIKILDNIANTGVTNSRNIGLETSLGEYILFIDSDDWIGMDFIHKLYELAFEYKVDAVLGALTYVWESKSEKWFNGFQEGLYVGKEYISSLLNIYDIDNKKQLLKWGIGGSLFRKDKYYPYQIKVDKRIKVGEDMAAFIPFIMESDRIYLTNNTAYYYRQHEFSTMHSKCSKAMDYYYLWEYLKPYLDNKPLLKNQVAHICCMGIESDYINVLKLKKQNFYMFPYELIPPHSGIVIFGAGIVGQSYYRQLEINHYCKVELLVDNNYNKNNDPKYPVVSPNLIKNAKYNYILIAVFNNEVSKIIYEQLLFNYDVPKNKIITYVPKMVTDFIDLEII